MSISAALLARAQTIEQHPRYSGPDLIDKTIIGITAPFAMGKSTLTNQCIAMLQAVGISAGVIGTETTREGRGNDPANYVTDIDPQQLIEKGERGELINLNIFETGHLYATSANSIPNDVNIGPLLPAALQKFTDANCKAVHAFYLTTTPNQWHMQLDADKRLLRSDADKRLQEAENSLKHAIETFENPGTHPLQLINNDGSRTIEEMAGAILYKSGFEQFERYAGGSSDTNYLYEMLRFVGEMQQSLRNS